MAEDSSEERTEAPSPKKRNDAREKGNVSKSTEINAVIVLLAGLFMLKIMSKTMYRQFSQILIRWIKLISEYQSFNMTVMVTWFQESVVSFFQIAFPVALSILLFGVFINIIQVGFLFTLYPLTPNFAKINPLAGLGRLFSARSFIEALKGILKISIIGIVAFLTIQSEFPVILTLCNASIGTIWFYILNTGFTIVLRTIFVLIILAIFDYLYQRFEYEKKLKMSHQEVKEERKQMEGDPQIKSRIRSLQREMARRRMMQDVPKATVVVTNPTHLAIAIRYEALEMDAPVIIAKGKQHIAEKIKEIAQKEKIPIVEDKPLARAMYDKIEPGDRLPVEFFNAVAEILAYVYRLKNKHAA